MADIAFLEEALPELKARTDLNKMVTDGGYVGPDIDLAMRKNEVEHITTGLTGTLPDHQAGRLALSDFAIKLDREGQVTQATCPAGQVACIRPSAAGKSFQLTFQPDACQACPFFQKEQCPIKVNKAGKQYYLRVPKDRASSSQRRRRFEQCKEEARNLRTAVEATVFQVKHPLRGGKLRVRGLFRVTAVFTCAALATNLRRINRYENDKQRGKYTAKKARTAAFSTIFSALEAWLASLYRLLLGFNPDFSC
jgi:hypothetical protein